jgi:hypothetical protein
MASRWVKWALRISAGIGGIIALCFVILVAWIAIELGLRWPTVQHVDQGPWADTLCIKAEDFLDDSGYVVTATFHNCCSERTLCAWPSSRQFISHLNWSNRIVSVPLHWSKRSMCSYRLYAVYIESLASHKFCSFSGDSALAPFPKILDVACLRDDQEDSLLHSSTNSKWYLHCSETLFSLPHSQDTIVIRKGQL